MQDFALEARKELSEYRNLIVYSSYQLGMGRLAYESNDLEGGRSTELDSKAGSSLAGIAKLAGGRFRAASRTSLGDIALQQGKFQDATKFYNDKKGAQDDKRLDLMCGPRNADSDAVCGSRPRRRRMRKSDDAARAAVANYRESLTTIETLRQGSLRADESRTTFLATIKDVFDEAASAYASLALLTNPSAGAPLSKQVA